MHSLDTYIYCLSSAEPACCLLCLAEQAHICTRTLRIIGCMCARYFCCKMALLTLLMTSRDAISLLRCYTITYVKKAVIQIVSKMTELHTFTYAIAYPAIKSTTPCCLLFLTEQAHMCIRTCPDIHKRSLPINQAIRFC